jgi:ABC-type branched-subunit amino acid transport system substrate-binding protein
VRCSLFRSVVVAVVSAAVILIAFAAPTVSAAAAGSVRGFDGTTITVAGFGGQSNFPNAASGAQARIKAFNDNHELKGIKLKWAGFADDKNDPATAVSEQRRLVTQEGVFAVVADLSTFNGEYFKQQHVPYFGWAFDQSYCSKTSKPDPTVYGFAFYGCQSEASKTIGDSGRAMYQYVNQLTGTKKPSILLFSVDNEAGKRSVQQLAYAIRGAGFDVVGENTEMAPPPVGDYTPYIQHYLTSDHGKAPDAMLCLTAAQCINVYDGLQAAGYKGTFISSLYFNLLVGAMKGSAASAFFQPFDQNTPGLIQMKKNLDAFDPGSSAKLDSGVVATYASADMFIQALKKVAAKGKNNITPENVQKVAAHQTWELQGVTGPTIYPDSTVVATPTCTGLVVSDGNAWNQVVPYACSTKQYPTKASG